MITITECVDRKIWTLDCKIHRDDGPAIEWFDGTKHWYLNGLLHRDNGPAREWNDGTKAWFLNGLRHRIDGPAIQCPFGKLDWYLFGKRHRIDGPALQWNDGSKYWYLDDTLLSPQEIKAHQISRLRDLTLALSPLELPPYVIFWILEWSEGAYIDELDQRSVIKLLEGIRNSRQKLKNIFI